MSEYIENKIYGFSVNNEYITNDLIIHIAIYLCKKYSWDDNKISYYNTYFDRIEFREVKELKYDYKAAWKCVIKAAEECQDAYALATLLFYKEYSYSLDTTYYFKNPDILSEVVNMFEELSQKDAFIYFLIGKSYYEKRTDSLDDRDIKYLSQAANLGIEMGNVYVYYKTSKYTKLYELCSKMIHKDPNNHILKFMLGHCYFFGLGTETNEIKAYESFKHTAKIENYNDTPIDVYFLTSRYYLGLCYFGGYGVEQDLQTANTLFRFSNSIYVKEAAYCEAISYILLKKENANPTYVYNLIIKSANDGYLFAVRKAMLCLKNNYGVTYDEHTYKELKEYFDEYKLTKSIYSNLGIKADTCPLIKSDGTIIMDDECLNG